ASAVAESLSLFSIIEGIRPCSAGGRPCPACCASCSAVPMISTFTMLAVYSRTPGCSTQMRRARTSYTAAVTSPDRPARNARRPGLANGDRADRARRDGAGVAGGVPLDGTEVLDATAGRGCAAGCDRALAAGLAGLAGLP